jgi:hypothetical protein
MRDRFRLLTLELTAAALPAVADFQNGVVALKNGDFTTAAK